MRSRLFRYILLLQVCSNRILSFQLHSVPTNAEKPLRRTLLSAIQKDSNSERRKKKVFTIADLQKEIAKNPAKFLPDAVKGKNKRYKRTRKRVENPKQQYLYKAQRDKLQQETTLSLSDKDDENTNNEEGSKKSIPDFSRDAQLLAKEFGLKLGAQHCDPLIDMVQPRIVGKIRVDESGSEAFAYLIDKPIGWSVLGGGKAKKERPWEEKKGGERSAEKVSRKYKKRVKIVDEEEESAEILEYSELDVLSLLTPEEREEYFEELGRKGPIPALEDRIAQQGVIDDRYSDNAAKPLWETRPSGYISSDSQINDPKSAENLKRIALRAQRTSPHAKTFNTTLRPSVVSWLKELKASEGSPIRGGSFWTGLAGATEVDDSGLLLLCPKTKTDRLFVDYTDFMAVVGTGGYLAPRQQKSMKHNIVKVEEVAKLRKGRANDVVQVARIRVLESPASCSDVVEPCQMQFQDGIRGDPCANPFDRRAARRLVHCCSISVSSLSFDEHVIGSLDDLPDDFLVFTGRRNNSVFHNGSFRGRSALKDNPLTNAYREINGVADGFPGWTVDRYDKWLITQHDPMLPRGPLPSIHDGNTLGVYYLESSPDRSAMGSESNVRPNLLEGQKAPDMFPVTENGVNYLVSMGDLSTGIFLDQRPQRAWLTRNCCAETTLLNCFSHTGCFSVAAASAGAATTSIDLSKKWLERLPQQLEANGISFDERHDCIFGDCFDWLEKLAKRGEKYDIVILDPPSTSVGGRKKKRWSVKNDMDELVRLAARLVKGGGLLWTTTNNASINAVKFARLCKMGLDAAGLDDVKLERIQVMPVDFPSVGPQPVKNLIWRIPL